MLCTGRRGEETCKIRKSNINKDRTLITLPASITKARKVEYVDITPPVAFVLKQLDKHLAGTYQGYRFVDWLFPTTRINKQRLHEDKYVRSESCRTKELRGCWNAVIKETGIVGVPKMLRKTFSSIAKLELGTTSKARVLTGHEQDATLDIHYDKSTEQQRKQYANQVSKFFEFEKASNE
jgi:integrase